MSRISRDSWLVLLVCIGISSFALINSLDNPQGRDQVFDIGANRYVQFLCATLITLGIISFLQGVFGRKKTAVHSQNPDPSRYKGYVKVASVLVASCVFMLVMKHLGFILSGIILMLSTTIIIKGLPKAREFGIQLLFTIITIFLVYLCFTIFIGVELP